MSQLLQKNDVKNAITTAAVRLSQFLLVVGIVKNNGSGASVSKFFLNMYFNLIFNTKKSVDM
jgi:hypothetical protein